MIFIHGSKICSIIFCILYELVMRAIEGSREVASPHGRAVQHLGPVHVRFPALVHFLVLQAGDEGVRVWERSHTAVDGIVVGVETNGLIVDMEIGREVGHALILRQTVRPHHRIQIKVQNVFQRVHFVKFGIWHRMRERFLTCRQKLQKKSMNE